MYALDNMAATMSAKKMGGMGFKDLRLFNNSLLAKQVWRLIRHPNSIVARVLKGRYHRHSDIMDAQLGNKPSYIWRSFMWWRDLLELVFIGG